MSDPFSVFIDMETKRRPSPGPPPPDRELLIALNAAAEISRPAVYRLSQELDRWFNAADTTAEPPEGLAASPRRAQGPIAKALALRERADELAARETAEAERGWAAAS